MMFRQAIVIRAIACLIPLAGCSQTNKVPGQENTQSTATMNNSVNKSEEEWKESLSPAQFEVLRKKGTERPFSGKFEDFYEKGDFVCAGCGNLLFHSATKFDAGCGWPSFYDVLNKSAVNLHKDSSHGMIRTEVTCANCGGHLGHVFDDGPKPTGLRYCINSVSIGFRDSTGNIIKDQK